MTANDWCRSHVVRHGLPILLALAIACSSGCNALAARLLTDGGSGVVLQTVPPAATWVPSYVNVETGEPEPGVRFVRTKMIWNDVSGFDPSSTFELDFILDNYDASPLGPGTYLDRSRALDQSPKVRMWRSNLPSAYLDTRFGDGNDEMAYTVGSGQARQIEAGKEYDTLIVTGAGDTDRDSARLSAQLGVQKPTGCTTTWCSFPAGSGSMAGIFPAWKIPVPGVVEFGTRPQE